MIINGFTAKNKIDTGLNFILYANATNAKNVIVENIAPSYGFGSSTIGTSMAAIHGGLK